MQKKKRFSEDVVRIYLAELTLALEDLHKRDIIFRDLKPGIYFFIANNCFLLFFFLDNIVIDKDGHALLTDFGLSKEGVYDQS